MIDERTRELIHAELDGELDPSAQGELDRRIVSEEQAQRLRDDLRRIAGALQRMPVEEPPLAIAAAVRQGTRPTRTPAMRYGWALAAGVAVAAVAVSVLRMEQPRLDPRDLAGTMATPATQGAAGDVPALSVSTPELHGTVHLQPTSDAWILNFRLDSTTPVSVSTQFDTYRLGYLGFAHGDAGATAIESAPGRVSFINHGNQRLALFFAPDSGGRIRVRFEAYGRVLQEGTLEVPGPVPASSQQE